MQKKQQKNKENTEKHQEIQMKLRQNKIPSSYFIEKHLLKLCDK